MFPPCLPPGHAHVIDVWSLLQPSSLLLVTLLLLVVALLLGSRRLAAVLGAVALLIGVTPIFLDVPGRLAWELEKRVPVAESLPASADGIIVLGGWLDWQVSRDRAQLNTNASAERLLAGLALARRYPEARLVFTGAYREDLPADFTVQPSATSLVYGEGFRGNTPTFIGEARSTYEDALLALERLEPRAGQTWLLVTSAMHMPRALGVFRQLGWNVQPYPVDYRTGGEPAWLSFDPRPGARLAELDLVIREWGALLVYSRSGRMSPP